MITLQKLSIAAPQDPDTQEKLDFSWEKNAPFRHNWWTESLIRRIGLEAPNAHLLNINFAWKLSFKIWGTKGNLQRVNTKIYFIQRYRKLCQKIACVIYFANMVNYAKARV